MTATTLFLLSSFFFFSQWEDSILVNSSTPILLLKIHSTKHFKEKKKISYPSSLLKVIEGDLHKLIQQAEFQRYLEKYPFLSLTKSQADKWIWTTASSGQISIKSAYWLCRSENPPTSQDPSQGQI